MTDKENFETMEHYLEPFFQTFLLCDLTAFHSAWVYDNFNNCLTVALLIKVLWVPKNQSILITYFWNPYVNKAEHAVQSYAAGVTICIGDILSNANAKQC